MGEQEASFIWLNSQDLSPLPWGNQDLLAIFMDIHIGKIVRKMIKLTPKCLRNKLWPFFNFLCGGNEEMTFDVGVVWLTVTNSFIKKP